MFSFRVEAMIGSVEDCFVGCSVDAFGSWGSIGLIGSGIRIAPKEKGMWSWSIDSCLICRINNRMNEWIRVNFMRKSFEKNLQEVYQVWVPEA